LPPTAGQHLSKEPSVDRAQRRAAYKEWRTVPRGERLRVLSAAGRGQPLETRRGYAVVGWADATLDTAASSVALDLAALVFLLFRVNDVSGARQAVVGALLAVAVLVTVQIAFQLYCALRVRRHRHVYLLPLPPKPESPLAPPEPTATA
jgi:hypothetical protein